MSHRTWFTFPDAAWSYDCAGCGACCRGLGIGLARGQVDALLSQMPALATFVRARGGALTVANPRGRCFFLDDGGLCTVETDLGRDAKPAACRLFPFNRTFLAGDWRIVDYNAVICPLRPDPDGGSGPIRHLDVLADIEAVPDPTITGVRIEAADELIREERAQTPLWHAADRWDAHLGADPEPTRAAIEAVLGRPATEPASTRVLAQLVPSLRFNELFGPRPYPARPDRGRVFWGMWVAFVDSVAQAEELAGRPMTIQQATGLFAELAPLTYLLARWNEAPALPAGPVHIEGPTADQPRLLAAARALHDNGVRRRPLGDVVDALIAGAPPHERVRRLRLLEPLLGAVTFGPAR